MQYRNHNPSYRPQNQQGAPRRSLAARLLPVLLIILVVVGIVLFVGKAMRDRRVADEVRPYEHIFADNIRIDGISLSGMTAQQGYDALMQHHEARVNSWQLALTYSGHTFKTIGYNTLGLSVLTDQINGALKEAWDLTHSGDAYQQRDAIQALRRTPFERNTAQSDISDQELTLILNGIAANIALQQPVDAAMLQFVPDQEDPFLFQQERVGYQLDVDAAREEIMAMASAGVSGAYELKPTEIQPNVTVAQLRQKYALRSIAQTAISRYSEEDRTKNIRVSLGRVNGQVLKPGSIFSFNKVAGPRTEKNGYFPALELTYGNFVTGIGGGVCQSSTTIYQAVLKAGLKITSRRIHSQPVNYADPGLDATVYLFGGYEIDFKFQNSTSSDIYMTARVKGSGKNLVAEVRIYGESLGDGVSYELGTNVLEVIPAPVEPVYQVDKDAQFVIYEDQTAVKSKGREGYVVESYLKRLLNGKETGEIQVVSKDTYDARAEVLWKGATRRPQ